MTRRSWSSASKGRSVMTSTDSPSESRKIAPSEPPVACSRSSRMVRKSKLRGASHLLFDGDVAAPDRRDEGLDDARIEARAGEALDLLHHVADLHRLLVR